MSPINARLYLVGFSLLCILICVVTFVTGRAWGFPLDYMQQEDLPFIHMLMPPFFGILASAVGYVRKGGVVVVETEVSHPPLLGLLIVGPSVLFLILFAIVSATFHFTNQAGTNSVFSLEEYRLWLTILITLLTTTTLGLSSFVFGEKATRASRARRPA